MHTRNPKKTGAVYSTPLGRDKKTQLSLQVMVLPAFVAVILFSYFPMYGVIIAFKKYDVFKGILTSPWADHNGFEHFIDFFNSPALKNIVTNTVFISFLKLVFCMFPPVIFAILLNEVRNIGYMKTVQTLSYLPHFISWAVAGGIFYSLLNPSTGAINSLLLQAGWIDKTIDFTADGKYIRSILVISHIWKGIGWASIIYLGVIVSIDQELYEAIEIDGGKRWAKVRYVTWPFLRGTFAILLILESGRIMSGSGDTFDQIYVMGNLGNRSQADIIDTYVLRVGLENARYSYATAVNLFKSILNIILMITANQVSKKLTDSSLF